MTIYTPRDRDVTFDPQVVRKREKILADSLADRIIGLCGIGNSTREISDILEEQFGNRISAETISSITDRVLSEIQNWKNRPLDRVYPIVWLDAVHYKVMDEKNSPAYHRKRGFRGRNHTDSQDVPKELRDVIYYKRKKFVDVTEMYDIDSRIISCNRKGKVEKVCN